MKNFSEDLSEFVKRLSSRKHFAFSKYADGEYAVLRNQKITNCDSWTFDPNKHSHQQKLLLDSFTYAGANYVIGISCPCCVPTSHVKWMRDNVNVKPNHLTWANLFVNSNYDEFKIKAFPIFNKWEHVTLVANEAGINKELPFRIDNYIPIKINSWLTSDLDSIIKQTQNMASTQSDQLFLFSAGPMGNILAHQLHLANPNNTYLDIGSTLNPWIVGNNRGYLNNNSSRSKTCQW